MNLNIKLSHKDEKTLKDFDFDFERNVAEYLERMANAIRFAEDENEEDDKQITMDELRWAWRETDAIGRMSFKDFVEMYREDGYEIIGI